MASRKPAKLTRAEQQRELDDILNAARRETEQLGFAMWAAWEASERSRRAERVTAGQRKKAGHRKKIEIYSAGCSVCQEVEAVIRRIARADYDVKVLDMHQERVARQAARRGIRSVPGVVVDGQLMPFSADSGAVVEAILRRAIAS